MSDKGFWGVVGGVLVLVLATAVFLFTGPMSEYGKAGSNLQRTVRGLKKYAGGKSELPTDDLVAAHEKRVERMKERLEETKNFLEERDQKFETYIDGLNSPNAPTWTARYTDANNALFESYKEHVGDPSLVDPPWTTIRNVTDVLVAQKDWRITSALVQAVLDIPRSKIRRCTKLDRARFAESDNFDFLRFRLEAEIPPAQLSKLLETVLAQDSVNFRLHSAAIVKNLNELTTSSVETVAPETPDREEPGVIARVDFDILDWNPKAPKAEE